MVNHKLLILVIAGSLLVSCNQINQNANAEESPDDGSEIQSVPATEVEVFIAEKGDFDHEIVSNGKLTAAARADLQFGLREMIRTINFRNGDWVNKGDTIAVLENYILKNKVEQTLLNFEKSKFNFMDLLIGQGYDYEKFSEIPEDILLKAKIKSGFAGSENDKDLAEFQYAESFLKAPISGVVANLIQKENNYPKTNEPFCSVIDTRVFEIKFQVMESEALLVKKGEKVEVHPYYETSLKFTGRVSEVNPAVDKNGLVDITALVENSNKLLIEGMNVKVFLKSPVKNKIGIPKEAVTIRSDKPVVFTHKNGSAYWNYVTTGAENNNSIIIEEGIQHGDTVIYKGNIHLAHGTEVVVVK